MATRKSEVEQARKNAQAVEAEEKRVGALDSRSEPARGDPLRSTAFLLGIVGVTLALCLIVMLILAAT